MQFIMHSCYPCLGQMRHMYDAKPGLKLENLNNSPFPTRVSLRNLSFEHHDQAYAIIATLEEIIGIDTTKDP